MIASHMTPFGRALSAMGTAAALSLAACNSEQSTEPSRTPTNGFAQSYGIWQPTTRETCTKEQHDKYSVVGSDGKLYPTWHPPNDPTTGCSFGHEHGRDPRGSKLYASVRDIPFGFANEQLDIYDPNGIRHEDHVGHKVEWENDIAMNIGNAAASPILQVKCDFLVKLHQGTHSKDAFTNNLHEMVYHIRCNDGTELHLTFMAAIGTPGEFVRSCEDVAVKVGPATPANSPRGGGRRIIPDRTCVDRLVLVAGNKQSDFGAFHESWQTSTSIEREDGKSLASFDPYFQVRLPSRFHDPAMTGIVGRPIDVCTMTGPNGERARGEPCAISTSNGAVTGLTYDDPRSLFNGVLRFVDINSNRVDNLDGPTVWYTNPFGKKGRPSPFAGSIPQYIARVSNGGLRMSGPGIGFNREYGGPGVHAPN
jgi:hypothetical protein